MTPALTPEFVTIGRIVSAFGIRGWVEVVSFTEPEDNLFTLVPWQLFNERQPNPSPLPVKILHYQPHKQKTGQHTWVVQLAESTDRDQALALRGVYMIIPRTQLPALGAHEYYWTDLEGLSVYNTHNVKLGEIDYLFATGANDVLVVKNNDKTLYIPYVLTHVVKNIDLQNNCMMVDWDE